MQNKTILIAEDDRSFRKGLRFELEDLGYAVTEAKDGKEAIELIHKEQFDLVISDLFMPEADGLDVFNVVQKLKPKTKVVIMTAFCNSEKAKIAEKILGDNFLRKPFAMISLTNKIADLCNSQKD